MACLEVFCISILMLWPLVCPDTGLKPELQSILITIDVVALLAFIVMRCWAERAYSLPDEAYPPSEDTITIRRLVQLFFIAVAVLGGIVLVPALLYVLFSIVIKW